MLCEGILLLILLIKKLDILAGPLFVAEYSIFRIFREKEVLSSDTNLYITNVCNFYFEIPVIAYILQ